jgi:hypothetical protein
MTKKEFDTRLSTDAELNKFSIDGDFIVFDKASNQNYQLLTKFKLGDLLTRNPVSKTRLNKNLLVSLETISEAFDQPLTIRASYRSPEYQLTTFGLADSELYTSGNALSIATNPENLENLIEIVKANFTKEVGLYKWGVHLGWSKEPKEWDTRNDLSFKQKVKDFATNDKMKNIALIGAAAAAVWFFFIKK